MELTTRFDLDQYVRIAAPQPGQYVPFSIRQMAGHRFKVREIVVQMHRHPQIYYTTTGRGLSSTKRLIREEYLEACP